MGDLAGKNHYQTLGIDHDESPEGVRRAFRQLAKACHPDCSGPEETDRFLEIAEAHEVLSDPARRRKYDLERACLEERLPASDDLCQEWPEAEPLSPISFVPGLGRDRASPWSGSIRDVTDEPRPFSTTAPLRFEVVVSRSGARRGGRLPLVLRRLKSCQVCLGTGRDGSFLCSICHGRGSLAVTERLELALPPGIHDGATLRGRVGGAGPSGQDILVVLRVAFLS